ncbi:MULTISPECIES: hypothetical protein [unclassified Mucilaginibacter]|uniref:hypothetical protein n=1 Tax=unclassified Mucilaginibacter TaxID=2617802 RepID=UPI002AC93101|nr:MULTISPECIES: hypothetical protein [unclassified Mucilaginibacter]MEB0262639.1 hypothetical protein [Mucilaginibacter sp. 10I4]MEB0280591.1 hypothetical protein [Mucilaginibacter sp. 10B2]MEB0300789.1 hypothetical protein [Mucilaginibacter sp. 5C4]WPX24991.1 hypothetical protein RHM67_06910 [Mucilaginibacter sp. 5C4]
MKVGDKVICVNDKIDADKSTEIRRDFEIWITKDKEYTIREILDNNNIVTGVLLDEVHNFPKFFTLINRYQEPAFAIWRFRKLNYAAAPAEAVSEVEELVGVDEKQEHLVKTK